MIIQELRHDLLVALRSINIDVGASRNTLNKLDAKLEYLGDITSKDLARLSESIRKQRLLESLIDMQKYLQEKNQSMKNLVNEDGKLK